MALALPRPLAIRAVDAALQLAGLSCVMDHCVEWVIEWDGRLVSPSFHCFSLSLFLSKVLF